MASPLVVHRSRSYPMAVEESFAAVLVAPLPAVFAHRYGPIAAIRSVSGQEGPWGTAGQTRTIHLGDGATMRETLTSVDTPTAFRYDIGDLTGQLRLLISRVEGSWSFEPHGTGVRITWAWTVHPVGSAAALAMPVLGRLWQGYARLALDTLETIVLPR
ncbi:MAG: SRPBCC family protein [Lapillicoccus sp.]